MLDPNKAQPATAQFAATLTPDHMVEIYRLDTAGQIAPAPYRRFADCPEDCIALTDCRLLPLANGSWALVGRDRQRCGAGPGRTVVPWSELDQVCWQDVDYAAPHPDGVRIVYHPQAAVRWPEVSAFA